MNRKHIVTFLITMSVLAVLGTLLFTQVSLAGNSGPQLYHPQAIPNTVHLGPQPKENPLSISVEIGTGGEISCVKADLSELSLAKYYDPFLDTMKNVNNITPLTRVYEIEGKEAYLIEAGSRYEYNEYITALSHNIVRGIATATNKWQVELPDVGNNTSEFSLRISATNRSGGQSSTIVPLKIVDDCTGPHVTVSTSSPLKSMAVRNGDTVSINVQATDDLSGVFSVRMANNSAASIFKDYSNLKFTLESHSDDWKLENTISENVKSGTYSVGIIVADRAGNETHQSTMIEITDEINSFQIDLNQGWNLISVPRKLENPNVNEVFSGIPVRAIQTVIDGRRVEASEITPGRGYLVQVTEDSSLTVYFAEHDLSAIPLTIKLGQGWNLIGYASQTLDPVMPLTFYLGDDLKDEWMIVYDDKGAQARTKSTSPYIWATDSFTTITGEPFSKDSDNLPVVELGKGYWIYLTGKGVLIP